jgi:hypothetical protein
MYLAMHLKPWRISLIRLRSLILCCLQKMSALMWDLRHQKESFVSRAILQPGCWRHVLHRHVLCSWWDSNWYLLIPVAIQHSATSVRTRILFGMECRISRWNYIDDGWIGPQWGLSESSDRLGRVYWALALQVCIGDFLQADFVPITVFYLVTRAFLGQFQFRISGHWI